MKTCRVCQQSLALSEFYFRKETGKHRTECKACQQQRQYYRDKTTKQKSQRAWRDRRFKLIQRYKTMKGCVDCGYRQRPAALDFDHVLGTKVKSVSQMLTHSKESLKAEIAKCEIVCANCHRIRTESRR